FEYEKLGEKNTASGNVRLIFANKDGREYTIEIIDHAHKSAGRNIKLSPAGQASVMIDLAASHGWYDFHVQIKEKPGFERRYAGRVETGQHGFSDPALDVG